MILMRSRAVLMALLLLPLSACSPSGAHSSLQVVASFYPLQWVTQRIAGDHASVSTLTSPGREPHDLELTIRQTAEVGDANVVVYEKGLQPAVDEAIATTDPPHVVDAMSVVATKERDGTTDPHVWLDPENMVHIAQAVETQLSNVDAQHASDYRAAFQQLRAELDSLDSAYHRQLQHCSLDTVVVSHDAYGYLPTPFTFEGIDKLSPDAEPSPARLAELRDLITSEHLTTVFTEPLGSAAMADTLASSAGVQTAVLDPIEGLSDKTSGEDYLTLMRKDLAALKEANRCQ
jgi:zinc transport system substrate-binding protein